MKKGKTSLLLILVFVLAFAKMSIAMPIHIVTPGSLSGGGIITFDDVAGGSAPGTNYDAIFESDGADFGERFEGQVLTTDGDFDVLSGSPTGFLSLAVGSPEQNLNVHDHSSNVLLGLGPREYPDYSAIGEGAFAVLFDYDQSEFGFDLLGGNGGNAYVDFFRRDGSLIDRIVLENIGWEHQSYAFQRDDGINDIAGISIYNDDPAGIGFDNLIHDRPGVPGSPNPAPEPGTMILIGSGLIGLSVSMRKFNKRVTS